MNKIKVIMFILVITISLYLSFQMYNYNNIIYSTFTTKVDISDVEKTEETEVANDENEEVKTENNSENNLNTTTSDNKVINKPNTSDNSNQNNNLDGNNNEIVEEEIIHNKHTCSSTDDEYINWVNNYLSVNSSTRIFNTLELAKSYGDSYMNNYGYGYFYSKHPITFDGDKCTKEVYTLQLYIPSDTCGNNEMLYLPNNINEIHSISYLRSIGYSCPEKVVKN